MNTQVLAPSATMLTVSNADGDWTDDQFYMASKRAALRKVPEFSTTVERLMLKQAAIISSVAADYKAHFAAVYSNKDEYGRNSRLPSEVIDRITKAVDKFINEKLSLIHPGNSLNCRTFFYHNSKEKEITSRIQATGENKVSLKEQLLQCHIMQRIATRKLDAALDKLTPDLDAQKRLKATLVGLEITEKFISGEIEYQKAHASTVEPTA